jgi:FkbM family methyltransferase
VNRLGENTDAPSASAALEELCQERSGALALDIGANIGQAARLMAPYFMQVVCFEPCAESFAILAAERGPNVLALERAVSDTNDVITLYEAQASIRTGQLVSADAAPGHAEWGPLTGSRRVMAVTIDCWVGHHGRLPDVVKVDTEGHEPQVLAGAFHTISFGYTAWFVEVHSRDHSQKVRRLLKHCAFERVDHDYLTGHERGKDHFYIVARPR